VHNRQQQLLWSIVTTIALVFMLAIMVVREQARQRYEVEFKNAVLREQIDHQQATDAQLRQAQKMEALGQLTGGIAHDFNNMLAIVVGNLEIALRRLHKDAGSIEKFIHNALLGAGKASDLTRRLLAFSRRQALHPAPVDVNACVHEMSSILSRSLGENITIALVPGEHLWAAFVDKSQLESAILNLAVNARDAMEDRGQLSIETANAYLDDNYARQNAGVSPGDYVMVAVSDTGHGMSPEVLRKVFEPFFTTKGVGKGTGLGLAQIHGFLAQSKGHIKIHSEVGVGTSVKLYLPRAGAHHTPRAAKHTELVAALPHAVLVVEDNAEVRDFVTMALEELGYTALQAESAEAAETMLRAHPEISILLTDVVMPGASGAQLADVVTKRHPELRVLLMSGYASEIVERATTRHCRFRLLTKPFTIQELAQALRSVLNDDPAVAVQAK
jgi:signal transduction histidine kinase/ActR/RegA family two-component response regulator